MLSAKLHALSDRLNAGEAEDVFPFDARAVAAPLPRAYQWLDGSAFLNHGLLMEKAFNTPPMPDFETIPLLYQGGSDDFLGPRDEVPLPGEEHGSACISERRVIELLDQGAIKTGFMKFGDTVRMESRDAAGRPLFGAIEQQVVKKP